MPAMAPPDSLLPPPLLLEVAAVAGMVMPPGLKLLRDTLLTASPAASVSCSSVRCSPNLDRCRG